MLHQSITAAALEKGAKKWEGTRGKVSQECQLLQALKTIFEVLGSDVISIRRLEDIAPEVVQECVKRWQASGRSPSTINSRLSTLSIVGLKTDGCWVRNKLPPKWWLRPNEQSRLLTYLRATPSPFPTAPLLADYIEFIYYTGLRVEEALRLTWRDVALKVWEDENTGEVQSDSEMTVPGTKTQSSHATLGLGVLPSMVLLKRKEEQGGSSPFVFPIKYDPLQDAWDKAREFLGERDNKMATLKALRRSAARHLTVKGMPTEMVRHYLRHSNIKTTMGYLHLVGGYSTSEQRRYLS